MIAPELFVGELQSRGTGFFTGVPDSLLKNLCAYITDAFDEKHHIIAANEGNAVAFAERIILRPGPSRWSTCRTQARECSQSAASACGRDVYRIPLLSCIGWRGEPGVHDEPQHVKQGNVTLSLLDTMGIPFLNSQASLRNENSVSRSLRPYAVEGKPCTHHPKRDYSATMP
jgi:phosphonopyruvate decarboxylase